MTIEGPKITFSIGDDIPSRFRKMVESRRDAVAFIFKNRRVKWGELGARINRVANALLSMGVGKGSRVAILSQNSPEYVESSFGALSAGACAVPRPSMASQESLKLMITDSAPAVIFISERYLTVVETFIAGISSLVQGGRIGLDFENDGWRHHEDFIKTSSDDAPNVTIEAKDEFHIIYSSGTTGNPKGIKHSHANRVAFVESFNPIFAAPGMVNIISTPFYSHTTMVTWLPSMRNGTTTVLMDKFDEREFLRLCEAEKVKIAMLVPAQYERILRVDDLDKFDLSSMLMKFCTSSPLHPQTKKRILDKMPGHLVELYGLTEGGVSTVLHATRFPDKLDSVGQPVPGCEIKIIDDNGNELPTGQIGEIIGRNSVLMTGYHNREKATRETLWLDSQGRTFLRSGDMGYIDKDGFIYVSGRKKDMIISGGFNIYPVDLETELRQHPAVREAAVIGAPSERWGETPLAFVVMDKDAAETPEKILEWVNSRLGKNQRISKIVVMENLPKSHIGKILKEELKKAIPGDSFPDRRI